MLIIKNGLALRLLKNVNIQMQMLLIGECFGNQRNNCKIYKEYLKPSRFLGILISLSLNYLIYNSLLSF